MPKEQKDKVNTTGSCSIRSDEPSAMGRSLLWDVVGCCPARQKKSHIGDEIGAHPRLAWDGSKFGR